MKNSQPSTASPSTSTASAPASKSHWLIAPYAAWMVLMMTLPAEPWAYAVRTVVTLALLAAAIFHFPFSTFHSSPSSRIFRFPFSVFHSSLFSGLLVGLLVLVIWIAPDHLDWYRRLFVLGDPYKNPAAHSLSDPFTWIQLFGSAFVISVAEELFFRKWLIRYAGFWWMVGLFAIEHNRWLVGAICGVLYGLLYLRRGLLAAVIAHATTNLLLGLYVLHTARWEFW